jgi:hypothetical protein
LKINIRANPKIPSRTKARIEFKYATSEKIESGKTRSTKIETIEQTPTRKSARDRPREMFMSKTYNRALTITESIVVQKKRKKKGSA